MHNSSEFRRIRALMKVTDHGIVCIGNENPLPPDEVPVAHWNPAEIAVARHLIEGRDLYEDQTLPRLVVSQRLQNVLQLSVPDQIQLLPVRLQSVDGDREFAGFAILRVLVTLTPGEAASRMGADLIYHVPNSPRDVRVSSSLYSRLMEAGLTGIDFC